MKRHGELYSKIVDINNLRLADLKARQKKHNTYGVIKHDKNREGNMLLLQRDLIEKRFKTSKYKVFTVLTPKERVIYQLPYYPDRIVHHALMNVLEPLWKSLFIEDTYACIKGRGIHRAMCRVKESLKDVEGTKYCLKFDIKKFYPSIDHDVLKSIVRKKIKCRDTLSLLDGIIDSAPGVPIGNYLSQYFANLYLSYFDHYAKEVLRLRYYFRYADDIVVLHQSKEFLHDLLKEIKRYLIENLKLELKSNYQVFPVEKRGIDFVGFVFYHSHTRMRKGIKKNFCRRMKKVENFDLPGYKIEVCSWLGWAKYSNSRHLLKTNLKYYDQIILRRRAKTA